MAYDEKSFLEDLIARVRALTPETPRRWGTLEPGEMLCHVTDVNYSYMGGGAAPEPGANVLRGVVRGTAYRGQDVCFNVSAPPLESAVLARAPAHAAARGGWRAGDSIFCCWSPEDGIVIKSSAGDGGEEE